jgi:hypothetical protein
MDVIRIVKRTTDNPPQPRIGNAFFTPIAKARGTQRRFQVEISEYPHVVIASRGDEEVVYTEVVHLIPSQALSLLEWLKQEEPTLRELAEEQPE